MTIYSYSRLKCFEQCPQKYKLQYIDKVKTETKESIELFLGKRVHETLKKSHQDIRYQKENTLEDLLAFLHNRWAKNWNDSVLIVKKHYKPQHYLKKAEEYIKNYYTSNYPFGQSRTIALEKRILVDLDDLGDYKLLGYIDRLTETEDSCYEIHDYKTSSRLPSPEDIWKDKQLPLYAICLKGRYLYVKDVRLIWHFLKFNKEIVSTPTDGELNELKQNTVSLIGEIESAKEFPVKPSRLCDWCKFKSICNH